MLTRERQSLIENTAQAKVWDLPVRVFHWTLVVSVLGAYITNRLGVPYFKLHVFFGCAVLVAVAFRILWGIMGTEHSLFRSFVRSPAETLRYSLALLGGKHRTYAGHNPLGALMVMALLAGLGAQAAAGLFSNDEIFNTGPLSGYVSANLSLLLTSLHRRLFYGIAAAAAFHVLAVLFHSIVFRERLIQAMFTGRKALTDPAALTRSEAPRTWLAVVLCLALSLILAAIVIYGPAPVDESI